MTVPNDVTNLSLAADGVRRIEWAAREMPVLKIIRDRFVREQPLKGIRMTCCLHVTTETANLAITLRDAGAEVRICASNPLSTQDDVAAALVTEYGISVFATHGEDNETYYRHIHQALEHNPQLTMDDGADVVAVIHKDRRDLLDHVVVARGRVFGEAAHARHRAATMRENKLRTVMGREPSEGFRGVK